MRPRRSLFIFVTVVVLISGSALWFCADQLERAFPLGGVGAWSSWTWALLLWAFPVVRFLFFRGSSGRTQGLAFFLLGLGSTFTVLLLVFKALELGAGLVGWYFPLWAPWVVLGMAVVLALWGMQTAFGPSTLRTLRLAKPGLHPDLDGLRIVQISDVHVSHLSGAGQIERLVAEVLALNADLIAVTGDLADGPLDSLRLATAPLANLKAPLGVHYVTGNHEYFWGVDGWLDAFKGMGFELLLNEHRVLTKGKAKLLVVGVNDPTATRMGRGGPDLSAAIAGAPLANYTLFLAHQPQAFALAEAAGADLFLAGHTHGGQFFPFPHIVSLFHRYFRGLYRHSDRLNIYIHSGSGFWGPPNRLGVPPEIALFILERTP